MLSLRQQTIKPLIASGSLRVVGISDFDPSKRMRAGLGLADDAFQVLLTRQLEESLPVGVQVLHVQQVRVVQRNQPVQPRLAIQKRPGTEINAIQPEEIERIVTWFASMCHQIVEVRAAFLVQHHNLAIQDRTLPFQTTQDLLKQQIKLTELLPLARQMLQQEPTADFLNTELAVLSLCEFISRADLEQTIRAKRTDYDGGRLRSAVSRCFLRPDRSNPRCSSESPSAGS